MRYTGKDGREYVIGLERESNAQVRFKSHLYDGTFGDPGNAMCLRGYNRQEDGYSIWRGVVGKGICRSCTKRADQGLDGVENAYYLKWEKEHGHEYLPIQDAPGVDEGRMVDSE